MTSHYGLLIAAVLVATAALAFRWLSASMPAVETTPIPTAAIPAHASQVSTVSAANANAEVIVEPLPGPADYREAAGEASLPQTMRPARERKRVAAPAVPALTQVRDAAGAAPEPAQPAAAPIVVERAPEPPADLAHHLARCAQGTLLERIVCDQRTRLAYCEGRWGESSECPGARYADYGR